MKSRKNRRKKTRIKKTRSKIRGGSCSCSNTSILGGSANLSNLPARYYYDLNTYKDPVLRGGKKKNRRIRGGSWLAELSSDNVISNMGNSGATSLTSGIDAINANRQYYV